MHERKRLLLLGANRSNLPSIREAREAGFFVIAADPNPDAAGLRAADLAFQVDVRECDRLLELIRQNGGVDGIVSMSEVGILSAAQMALQLGLPAISDAVAHNARSKASMRQLWAGLPFSVDFDLVTSEAEAERAAMRLGFPVIFKPDLSFGGSRGVSRVTSPAEIAEAFRFAAESGLPGSGVVVECCVCGTEHSCEVLIYEGRTSVLCIGRKVKSAVPYRVDISVQYPAALTSRQETTVAEVAHAAVSALGLTRGAAHIEFAYTDAGPVLFELGARCGGGHTPEIAGSVSGVAEFIEVCRMACGLPPRQFKPKSRNGADYRFIIFPPGRVAEVRIPDSVREHAGILDIDVLVRPGSEIHPVRSTSDRAGFVVSTGRDYREAGDLADWVCDQIAVTYSDGRVSSALPLRAFTNATNE